MADTKTDVKTDANMDFCEVGIITHFRLRHGARTLRSAARRLAYAAKRRQPPATSDVNHLMTAAATHQYIRKQPAPTQATPAQAPRPCDDVPTDEGIEHKAVLKAGASGEVARLGPSITGPSREHPWVGAREEVARLGSAAAEPSREPPLGRPPSTSAPTPSTSAPTPASTTASRTMELRLEVRPEHDWNDLEHRLGAQPERLEIRLEV